MKPDHDETPDRDVKSEDDEGREPYEAPRVESLRLSEEAAEALT